MNAPPLSPPQRRVLDDALALADVIADGTATARERYMSRQHFASFEDFRCAVPELIALGYLTPADGDISRVTPAGREARRGAP